MPMGSGIRQSDAMGLMKESGLKSNNTEKSAFEDISVGLLPTPWSFQYSSRLSDWPS